MASVENINNGEPITYGRHPDTRLSFVLAALRTRESAHGTNKPESFPLGVHTSSKKAVALVDDKHTSAQLQAIVKMSHWVTSKTELQSYASQSNRVGAYV